VGIVKIHLGLFLLLVVFIAGCVNTRPIILDSDNGIKITSFEASPESAEFFDQVFFDLEFENVGGTTAEEVKVEILGLKDSWRRSTDLNDFVNSDVTKKINSMKPPIRTENRAGDFELFSSNYYPPFVPKGTEASFPVTARIVYNYATTGTITIPIVSKSLQNSRPTGGKIKISNTFAPLQISLRNGPDPLVVDDVICKNLGKCTQEETYIIEFVNKGDGLLLTNKEVPESEGSIINGTIKILGSGATFSECIGFSSYDGKTVSFNQYIRNTEGSVNLIDLTKLRTDGKFSIPCKINIDRSKFKETDSTFIILSVEMRYKYFVEETRNIKVKGTYNIEELEETPRPGGVPSLEFLLKGPNSGSWISGETDVSFSYAPSKPDNVVIQFIQGKNTVYAKQNEGAFYPPRDEYNIKIYTGRQIVDNIDSCSGVNCYQYCSGVPCCNVQGSSMCELKITATVAGRKIENLLIYGVDFTKPKLKSASIKETSKAGSNKISDSRYVNVIIDAEDSPFKDIEQGKASPTDFSSKTINDFKCAAVEFRRISGGISIVKESTPEKIQPPSCWKSSTSTYRCPDFVFDSWINDDTCDTVCGETSNKNSECFSTACLSPKPGATPIPTPETSKIVWKEQEYGSCNEIILSKADGKKEVAVNIKDKAGNIAKDIEGIGGLPVASINVYAPPLISDLKLVYKKKDGSVKECNPDESNCNDVFSDMFLEFNTDEPARCSVYHESLSFTGVQGRIGGNVNGECTVKSTGAKSYETKFSCKVEKGIHITNGIGQKTAYVSCRDNFPGDSISPTFNENSDDKIGKGSKPLQVKFTMV
jgi:hypothetical protein